MKKIVYTMAQTASSANLRLVYNPWYSHILQHSMPTRSRLRIDNEADTPSPGEPSKERMYRRFTVPHKQVNG